VCPRDEKVNFTEVISPINHWFRFDIKEVWRYRDLVLLFVRRDFVAQYKQTLLGPLWLIVQPILTTCVFYIVFSRIAHIPTNGVEPFTFYLSGITLWNYFSDCLTKTSNTFLANSGIFGKVYFPRLVIPISVVISNLVKLGIQTMLLLLVIALQWKLNGHTPSWNIGICIYPLLVLILALLGLGLGLLFSSLTTKYRDLSYLLTFAVQLLMYATPILYPLSFTNGLLSKIISMNPLSPIFETFRYGLFSEGIFNFTGLLYTLGFSLLTLFFGIIFFHRVERTFIDTV
jgi:lipopolysaccharide transport system permease protein